MWDEVKKLSKGRESERSQLGRTAYAVGFNLYTLNLRGGRVSVARSSPVDQTRRISLLLYRPRSRIHSYSNSCFSLLVLVHVAVGFLCAR